MKTRQIVEFLIYPHVFNSFSILYKGVYCVSFKLYHISENKSITHAFPFIISHPGNPQSIEKNYEEPTVHGQSNFSFQTERFYMIYEQDSKKLSSQCVFRLQFQENKSYTTYLSCKLLKKITKEKSGDTNFCARKVTQSKFECIDTQVFILNFAEQTSTIERIIFRSSQFFSAIDLIICTFRYGSKSFRGKDQLSKMFIGFDLSKVSARFLLQQKLTKKQSRQQQEGFETKFAKSDLENYIGLIYLQLQKSIEEYNKWYREVAELRKNISSFHFFQKHFISLILPDLSYLNRGRILKAVQLSKIYQTQSPQETLVCILEQKELLRQNIRALREYYSTLLFYYSEKQFKQHVKNKIELLEELKIKKFVKFQSLLTEKDGELLRNTAGQSYSKEIIFVPEKIERIPVLLVEGYQQKSKDAHNDFTLTVFVHGYQGNSFDFQKSKNYLKRFNRHTHLLVIQSITDDMNKSIQDLGKAVAQEVKRHLLKTINHYSQINFVGFSLGGLIVRACLPFLNENCEILGIFVSFSSPHLGISELSNNLVKLGIWFLTKMQKVQNLKELNFQSVQFHDSFLMKLSKCELISKFKKIVLVSSKDDGFVPLYSTLLQQSLCQKQILLLCKNLRGKIKRLERVEVMFSTDHAGPIDKLTGRRGHIQFLDNDYFLQFFFKLYAPFF